MKWPKLGELAIAGGLALALNPIVRDIGSFADKLFPTSEAIQAVLRELTGQIPNLGVGLLVFALMPAITEEFAFRGYILSGLQRTYKPGTAIVFSALLFGILHVLLSLFVQFFGATLLGLVIGLIAIRSGSLWPGVLFHFINNALGLLTVEAARDPRLATLSSWLFRDQSDALYRPAVLAVATAVSVVLLTLIWRSGIEKSVDKGSLEDLAG